MSRLADRWSLGSLAATASIAFAAWWFIGDPICAVTVLVAATARPLILAAPIAPVAGLSRAADFGVLIKRAGPLETMARIRPLILDKTGTLTDGDPQIVRIESQGGMASNDTLRLAASLEQASKHPVARAVVAAANGRGFSLPVLWDVADIQGEGVVGHVEGRKVLVGSDAFVAPRVGRRPGDHSDIVAGPVLVAFSVDERMAGHRVMSDPLRKGAGAMLDGLRREGISRILLATCDRVDVAERVTRGLGLDGLRAGLTPEQKVLLILTERKRRPPMMVGEGRTTRRRTWGARWVRAARQPRRRRRTSCSCWTASTGWSPAAR